MAAPRAITISLTEIAALFGVTTEAIRQWRKEGFPSRMVSGQVRFVAGECVQWRRERDRAERPGATDGKDEKLRILRAEADLKEMEVRERAGALVAKQLFDEEIDRFVGGLVAAVMGRLQQFERDIVQAVTPQQARAVMDRIQEEVLRAAREYAQELEVDEEGDGGHDAEAA